MDRKVYKVCHPIYSMIKQIKDGIAYAIGAMIGFWISIIVVGLISIILKW